MKACKLATSVNTDWTSQVKGAILIFPDISYSCCSLSDSTMLARTERLVASAEVRAVSDSLARP